MFVKEENSLIGLAPGQERTKILRWYSLFKKCNAIPNRAIQNKLQQYDGIDQLTKFSLEKFCVKSLESLFESEKLLSGQIQLNETYINFKAFMNFIFCGRSFFNVFLLNVFLICSYKGKTAFWEVLKKVIWQVILKVILVRG